MRRYIAVAISALLLAGVSTAQPMRGGEPPMLKKLNLTADQQKQFDASRDGMTKQMIDHRAKMQTARLELQQLLKADAPERAAIEKKMKEIADLGVKGQLIRVDHWFAVNKILTPEQQKEWKNALEHGPQMVREGMMQRMKGRGDFGPKHGRGFRGDCPCGAMR